jgi:hypothetical protein
MMACGGSGSGAGSGGDGASDEPSGFHLRLRWSSVAGAAGYVIHWGASSASYTHDLDVGDPIPDEGGAVTFVLEDVAGMGTIYFAITSYDDQARMSPFSNELSAVVP